MNPAHRAIIEALCTEIETSIREGSTIVESPACKAAREYLADTEVRPTGMTVGEWQIRYPIEWRACERAWNEIVKATYHPNMLACVITPDFGGFVCMSIVNAYLHRNVVPTPHTEGPSGTLPHGVET